MKDKVTNTGGWIKDNKHVVIPTILTIIFIILIINFSYGMGWNFGYEQKVIGVNKPMIKSVGYNCQPTYVRKIVKTTYSVIRGLFNCADENESVRAHPRVLFSRVRSLDEVYGFKGAGYVYDCNTRSVKVILPYPLDKELLFNLNISQAEKFCDLNILTLAGYDLAGSVEIISGEEFNETFYGFEDLEQNLNSSNN